MNSDKLKVVMPYASVGCCGLGGIVLFIFALVNSHAPVKTMLMISALLLIVEAGLTQGKKQKFLSYRQRDRENGGNRKADIREC